MRDGGGSTVSGVAGAVITGAMTLGQAFAEPQQNSLNTQGNWADSAAETRGADEARTQRGETRNKGYRAGGSGKLS